MAKAKTSDAPATPVTAQILSIAASMSRKPKFHSSSFWIVGDTPLITHAWSQKAKAEMLSKQVGGTKPGKEKRDPDADYLAAIYPMGDGKYGFPVTGIKNCIMSGAHKDKGIARTTVMSALWLDAEMTRVMPALSKAICDMPLVRIYGSDPEMREDMVKVGSGLNKVASLAYRPQFTQWAIKVRARYNADVLSAEQIAFLIQEAGISYGLGEWRNERKGIFGAFHLATVDEEADWDAFAAGEAPVPAPFAYAMAAE